MTQGDGRDCAAEAAAGTEPDVRVAQRQPDEDAVPEFDFDGFGRPVPGGVDDAEGAAEEWVRGVDNRDIGEGTDLNGGSAGGREKVLVANPFTVFDLTPGRSQEFPTPFLGDFTGFVHADADAGYNPVHRGPRHGGCWMHARRGFHDARATDPRAADALAYVRTLYDVGRRIADRGPRPAKDAVTAYRRPHARPVPAAFAAWLAEPHRRALPSSAFGQAVNDARNPWPTLTRYADNHRLAIDNGPAERAIRPLAVGRRNGLFGGGDGGLASAAVLLSVGPAPRGTGTTRGRPSVTCSPAPPPGRPTPICPTSSPTGGNRHSPTGADPARPAIDQRAGCFR